MSDIQYTIRSIPKPVDDFLRRDAKKRGISLNQVVLGYMQESVKRAQGAAGDDFAWLIGSNTIDDTSLRVIQESKDYDKRKQHHL